MMSSLMLVSTCMTDYFQINIKADVLILDSVAALTKVLARASGETKAESLLHEVASWWLLACGMLYIVSVSYLRFP